MKCPDCNNHLRHIETIEQVVVCGLPAIKVALYQCEECEAEFDFYVRSRELRQTSEGVRPADRPSTKDLFESCEDILSAQDHLPNNEYA